MADNSARLLLLLSLLQARRAWPAAVLADRLEVSRRTLRRDIDRLRGLGYPVIGSKGPGGAYRLDAGARLPPLLFDDEQAVAVALALQTAPSTVDGIDDAAGRALATIRQVMPAALRQRIDAIRVTRIPNAWDLGAPQVAPDVLLAVGSAVRNRQVLGFEYAAASTGTGTAASTGAGGPAGGSSYRIEPHHLVVWAGRWYLVGWECDQRGWRTFRIDRVTSYRPTGRRFPPRELPDDDVMAFVTSEFDRGDTPEHWPCQGEVLLDAPASLIARWVPGGAVVEEITPERCRLTIGAWSWTGLAALIGTFAADIEVLGPAELVAACAELSGRYAKAAGLVDPTAARRPDARGPG